MYTFWTHAPVAQISTLLKMIEAKWYVICTRTGTDIRYGIAV